VRPSDLCPGCLWLMGWLDWVAGSTGWLARLGGEDVIMSLAPIVFWYVVFRLDIRQWQYLKKETLRCCSCRLCLSVEDLSSSNRGS